MAHRLLVRLYERAFKSPSLLAKPVCYVMEVGWLGLLMMRTGIIVIKRWITGYQAQDWMDSPYHALAMSGLRMSSNVFTLRHRFLNFVCCVILKHREYLHTTMLNHVGLLDHAVNQKTLRNLLVWQMQIYARNPVLPNEQPLNLILRIGGGTDPANLIDLFCLFVMLPHFQNLDFSWDEAAAEAAIPLTMSWRDRQTWAKHRIIFNLAAPLPAEVRELESAGCPKRFAHLLDSRKRFNDFIKAAAPGKVVITVSLPETDDLVLDPLVLSRWAAVLLEIRKQDFSVVFMVANRVSDWDRYDWPACIRPLRNNGFTLMDVITAAQNSEGFVGVLDAVGLAAYSDDVPGLYMPLEPRVYEGVDTERETTRGANGRQRRLTYMPEPEDCVESIRELLGILRPAITGRPLTKTAARGRAIGGEHASETVARNAGPSDSDAGGERHDARVLAKGE